MLAYDTDMEEIAFSRDRQATLKAADAIVHAHSIKAGTAYEDVFRIGQKFHEADCFYIAWPGDNTTLLFFKGPRHKALARLRHVPPLPDVAFDGVHSPPKAAGPAAK